MHILLLVAELYSQSINRYYNELCIITKAICHFGYAVFFLARSVILAAYCGFTFGFPYFFFISSRLFLFLR